MNKNLVPQSDRTKEERREIAKMGGIASGIARRKKKQLREYAEAIMSLPASDVHRAVMEDMGVDEEDMTNGMAMVYVTMCQALGGNPKHINIMREMLGERVIEHKVTTNLDAAAQELNDLLEETELSQPDPE